MPRKGTPRTIHFFRPVVYDSANVRLGATDNDFFEALHGNILTLGESQYEEQRKRLTPEIGENQYVGFGGDASKPATKFLYIGRIRPQSDWPDMMKGETFEPLDLGESTLVEPAYICPVPRSEYIAVLRTSGGPTWSAIEQWITLAYGKHFDNERIELEPYSRGDQHLRLQRAIGVSKLDLKLDPGEESITEHEGQIARAMQGLQVLGQGSVSVDVQVSFGHARPNEAVAQGIAEELRRLIGKVRFKRAQATLMELDEKEQQISREHVDFLKDKVTYTEYVQSNDGPPERSEVLHAVLHGIERFQKVLSESSRSRH